MTGIAPNLVTDSVPGPDVLQLVPMDISWATDYASWLNDPVVQHQALLETPRLISSAQAVRMLEQNLEAQDAIFFGLVQTNTNERLGYAALGFIDSKNRLATAGLVLGCEASRGRGFGRQGLGLLTGFAFDELNLKRLQGEILSYNVASLRLVASLGWREEGVRRQACYKAGAYHDVTLVALLRNEVVQ